MCSASLSKFWIMNRANITLLHTMQCVDLYQYCCFVSGKLFWQSWQVDKNQFLLRIFFFFCAAYVTMLGSILSSLSVLKCWEIHLQYIFLKGSGKNVYCVLCWIFYRSFFFVFTIIEFYICCKKKFNIKKRNMNDVVNA